MIVFGTVDGRKWEPTTDTWDEQSFGQAVLEPRASILAHSWDDMDHTYYINTAQIVWWRDADA